jgi:hypothetical protein
MTNAEQALGYDAVKHLDQWLAANLGHEPWELVLAIRERMMTLAFVDDYWLDQGWQRTYDQVKGAA